MTKRELIIMDLSVKSIVGQEQSASTLRVGLESGRERPIVTG
jgi:hypothetical protein